MADSTYLADFNTRYKTKYGKDPSAYDSRAYSQPQGQPQGSNAQSDRDYQRQRAEYDRRYAEWARDTASFDFGHGIGAWRTLRPSRSMDQTIRMMS